MTLASGDLHLEPYLSTQFYEIYPPATVETIQDFVFVCSHLRREFKATMRSLEESWREFHRRYNRLYNSHFERIPARPGEHLRGFSPNDIEQHDSLISRAQTARKRALEQADAFAATLDSPVQPSSGWRTPQDANDRKRLRSYVQRIVDDMNSWGRHLAETCAHRVVRMAGAVNPCEQ